MPNRICIFVHYDNTDVIAPCVERYLRGLAGVCGEILFVTNSKLSVAELNKVLPLVSGAFSRENTGMDFGAWKYVIDQVGWDYIGQFDELVLANDSCYAPMFPFDEMFNTMHKLKTDFWGVTEHPAAITRSGDLEAHLQSYFVVLKHNVVTSNTFREFWESVSEKQTDYNKVIGDYEARLTPLLNSAGFKHCSYLEETGFTRQSGGNWDNPLYINPTIWDWKNLLKSKSPFLKRRAISFHLDRVKRLILSGYGPKVTAATYDQTFLWRRCISDSGSSYPIDIIDSEIQSIHGDSWVKSRQHFKRFLFYICGPNRFFRKVKRLIRAR